MEEIDSAYSPFSESLDSLGLTDDDDDDDCIANAEFDCAIANGICSESRLSAIISVVSIIRKHTRSYTDPHSVSYGNVERDDSTFLQVKTTCEGFETMTINFLSFGQLYAYVCMHARPSLCIKLQWCTRTLDP